MPVTTRVVLCSAADVAVGTAKAVAAQGRSLAVFNVAGEYHVTDNACTHGPGLLAEGYLEDAVIECDFHGGQFDVRTGEVVAPPCMEPVRTYRTVVDEGRVVIFTD